jgi:hypothetical protein
MSNTDTAGQANGPESPDAKIAGNDIEGLRQRLFETIDGLRNGKLSLDTARQIGEIAQVVVNSAKVEVDYLKTTDRRSSRFLGTPADTPAKPKNGQQLTGGRTAPGNGIVGIRQHLLGD